MACGYLEGRETSRAWYIDLARVVHRPLEFGMLDLPHLVCRRPLEFGMSGRVFGAVLGG